MDVHGTHAPPLAGVRWRVAAPHRRAGLVDGAEHWLNAGRATLVKRGDGRAVYRLDLPQRAVYLKHETCGGWRHWLRRWFRPSAVRREFVNAQALRRRQVPAIESLAWGRTKRDRFLLTAAVPGSEPLDAFLNHRLGTLSEGDRGRVMARVVAALARLCATAHRAGVEHRDLHTGNVLIDTLALHRTDWQPQLRLLDLPSVRLRRRLGWRASRNNLALLASQYLRTAEPTTRARFWIAYLRARPDLRLDPRRAAAEIQRRAERQHERVLARREKRAWGENNDFYVLPSLAGVAHAVREVPRDVLTQFMAEPASIAGMLPLYHRTVPIRVETFASPRGWRARLGRHPALTLWRDDHARLARGDYVLRPLAVFVRRDDGRAYLVREIS